MPESLFTTESPSNETSESPGPTLGTVIVVAVSGQVTHLKWYCPAVIPTNGSALPFTLYNATTQAQLGRVTAAVTPGWNTVALTTPVSVAAGTRLIAAVYTGSQYAYTPAYYTTSRVVGNLTAPATGSDPTGNGRFRSGSDGVPTSGSGTGLNYWTDLVFVADATTTPVTSSLTGKWRIYAKMSASSLTGKWRIYAKVFTSLTAKWRIWSEIHSTLTGKWRVLAKVISRLTAKWHNLAAPNPEPSVSSGYLTAQRSATKAFIADDPTTITLIPRDRVATQSGGYQLVDGVPRPAQTVKMVLLSSDQRPTVTVAGVERVVDYHLVGPYDMQIAVGDVWDAEDGTRWEVVGFSEGWDYMTKAFISRHVPRGVKP